MKDLNLATIALLSAWASRNEAGLKPCELAQEQFNAALEAVIDERIKAMMSARGMGEPRS